MFPSANVAKNILPGSRIAFQARMTAKNYLIWSFVTAVISKRPALGLIRKPLRPAKSFFINALGSAHLKRRKLVAAKPGNERRGRDFCDPTLGLNTRHSFQSGHPRDWFSRLTLPVATVLEFQRSPTALWSHDRSKCILTGQRRSWLVYRIATIVQARISGSIAWMRATERDFCRHGKACAAAKAKWCAAIGLSRAGQHPRLTWKKPRCACRPGPRAKWPY